MENIKEVFEFLKELSVNNTREWLTANDARFKEVKSIRDGIAEEFIQAVSRLDPRAAVFRPSDITYRFMRDTRFSPDKTPYKTHIGFFICPPLGKKSLLSGYYLHLEPGKSILCGGNYCLPTKMLTAIRNDIRDNIEEYIGIVESPEFKKYFKSVGFDLLKTAPKGFDKNWEYIDYVRPREFGIEMELKDSYFNRKNAIADLGRALEQIKRYNDFINFSIEESGLPLMREGRR